MFNVDICLFFLQATIKQPNRGTWIQGSHFFLVGITFWFYVMLLSYIYFILLVLLLSYISLYACLNDPTVLDDLSVWCMMYQLCFGLCHTCLNFKNWHFFATLYIGIICFFSVNRKTVSYKHLYPTFQGKENLVPSQEKKSTVKGPRSSIGTLNILSSNISTPEAGGPAESHERQISEDRHWTDIQGKGWPFAIYHCLYFTVIAVFAHLLTPLSNFTGFRFNSRDRQQSH